MAKSRKSCCCGCIVLLALIVGTGLLVFWTLDTPENVTVRVDLPPQARSGEPLTLVVNVRNESAAPRRLRGVFFSGDLLNGMTLGTADPAVSRRVETGPFNHVLLAYDLPIPAGGEVTVRVPATAGPPRTHRGAVHVSIDGLTTFTTTQAELVVVP